MEDIEKEYADKAEGVCKGDYGRQRAFQKGSDEGKEGLGYSSEGDRRERAAGTVFDLKTKGNGLFQTLQNGFGLGIQGAKIFQGGQNTV